MLDKTVDSLAAAVAGVQDGAVILIGGFGASGVPTELICALLDQGARELTIVNNNAGNGKRGLSELVQAGRVRKMICSFARSSDRKNPNAAAFADAYRAGKVELECVPQGTMAERMRAAGAGLGPFFTPTAFGTPLSRGKETRVIDGVGYVLESPLKGDYAFVKARTADRWGNLVYRYAGRNFAPVMCMAAATTVAQVDEIVDLGGIPPEHVMTPGIFVKRVVQVERVMGYEKLSRRDIARLVAADIEDGAYVNLGIGIPTQVSAFLPQDRDVILHTENGIVGMGPGDPGAPLDLDLINASKEAVTLLPGASITDHVVSFAMMRGGHLDLTVLGAFQVSEKGDLANWDTGAADTIPAVGGAMDLVAGARQVYITMEHVTKDGQPKIVRECTYPLTGAGVVDRIYTDLAILDVTPAGMQIRAMVAGLTFDELQALTGCPLALDPDWRTLSVQ